MKTNVLIPMAGSGKRFEQSYPNTPKPFISINGESMLSRVIQNLNQDNVNFIFISQDNIIRDERFQKIINNQKINYQVVSAPEKTDGPACSCLLAERFIDNDHQLIIANCDQIILDFSIQKLIKFAEINNADGVIGVFNSISPKNSYVKLNNAFCITEVKEKIVISNLATNGIHYWKNGRLFVESAKKMIKNKELYNGEYYVAPTYNFLIKNNKKIIPFYYNLHFPIGIPEDLDYYKGKYDIINN